MALQSPLIHVETEQTQELAAPAAGLQEAGTHRIE